MSFPTTAIYFSESFLAAPVGNQLCLPQTDNAVPEQSVTFYPQLATTALNGVVKPDGTSITIDPDGTIHAPSVGNGGGGGGGSTSASGGLYVCVSPTRDPTDGTRTQWILPAPQLAGTIGWGVRNGVTMKQNGVRAEFSVQGTHLTLKDPLEDDGLSWLEYYYIMGTPNSQSGGGGNVNPSSLRGTSSASTSSATFTIPFPAAAQAGDFAVLFAAHGYNFSDPSGWTLLQAEFGGLAIWQGKALSKLLTSADITAGSVTIAPGRAAFGLGAMAVFAGATGGARESEGNRSTGGAGTDTLSTTSAVLNTDIGLYFGTAGDTASTPTLSMSPGTTLETPSTAGSAGIMAMQAMPGGVTAQAFTYSTAFAGFIHFVVIVEA